MAEGTHSVTDASLRSKSGHGGEEHIGEELNSSLGNMRSNGAKRDDSVGKGVCSQA